MLLGGELLFATFLLFVIIKKEKRKECDKEKESPNYYIEYFCFYFNVLYGD